MNRFSKWAVSGLVGLIGLTSCTTSKYTGEVEAYKIAPGGLRSSNDEAGAYLLKPRGFAAAEDAYRIRSGAGSTDGVGVLNLKETVTKLREDAARALHQYERTGSLESPDARRVTELSERLKKIDKDFAPGPNLESEQQWQHLLVSLSGMKRGLEDISDTLKDAEWDLKEGHQIKRFDVLLTVFGRPLVRLLDYDTLINDLTDKSKSPLFVRVDYERYCDKFSSAFDPVCQPSQEGMLFCDLQEDLQLVYFDILETSLNISSLVNGTNGKATTLRLRKTLPEEPASELNDNESLASEQKCIAYEDVDLDRAFRRLRLNLAKANLVLRQLIDISKRKIAYHSPDLWEVRAKLEVLGQELAERTLQNHFRRIRVAPKGKPPTKITFLLKTLFVKQLGSEFNDDRELLVTCAVKTSENAGEKVYPLIFEPDFEENSFVNHKDRIIYGPVPYMGQAMDVRLSVFELDDLENKAIEQGFASVVATVGAANPEFAAVAPAVNVLFGSILRHANANQKEFDFSFTLPQPEGENLPDSDFLITECGHYILIKRESPNRNGDNESKKRQLYRSLVYNREDGLLYKRVVYDSLEANFQTENLFTAQSYAVIAITDEYTDSDDTLGEQLRKQVAQTLGEARAAEFLPSAAQTSELIASYSFVNGMELKKLDPIDGKGFEEFSKRLKDELWQSIPDFRKQFITEILYSRSDEATRISLGKDPDRWRTASISVDPQGFIHLGKGVKETYAYTLGDSLRLFPSIQNRDSFAFRMIVNGQEAESFPGIGSISSDGIFQWDRKDLAQAKFKVIAREKALNRIDYEGEVLFLLPLYKVICSEASLEKPLSPGAVLSTASQIKISVTGAGNELPFKMITSPAYLPPVSLTNNLILDLATITNIGTNLSITVIPSAFERILLQMDSDQQSRITTRWPVSQPIVFEVGLDGLLSGPKVFDFESLGLDFSIVDEEDKLRSSVEGIGHMTPEGNFQIQKPFRGPPEATLVAIDRQNGSIRGVREIKFQVPTISFRPAWIVEGSDRSAYTAFGSLAIFSNAFLIIPIENPARFEDHIDIEVNVQPEVPVTIHRNPTRIVLALDRQIIGTNKNLRLIAGPPVATHAGNKTAKASWPIAPVSGTNIVAGQTTPIQLFPEMRWTDDMQTLLLLKDGTRTNNIQGIGVLQSNGEFFPTTNEYEALEVRAILLERTNRVLAGKTIRFDIPTFDLKSCSLNGVVLSNNAIKTVKGTTNTIELCFQPENVQYQVKHSLGVTNTGSNGCVTLTLQDTNRLQVRVYPSQFSRLITNNITNLVKGFEWKVTQQEPTPPAE